MLADRVLDDLSCRRLFRRHPEAFISKFGTENFPDAAPIKILQDIGRVAWLGLAKYLWKSGGQPAIALVQFFPRWLGRLCIFQSNESDEGHERQCVMAVMHGVFRFSVLGSLNRKVRLVCFRISYHDCPTRRAGRIDRVGGPRREYSAIQS